MLFVHVAITTRPAPTRMHESVNAILTKVKGITPKLIEVGWEHVGTWEY